MLLNWWCCRVLAHIVHLPPIPTTPANPYVVWEIISQTGEGWGRQVVFVSWLINLWGVKAAKRIWQHIRSKSKHHSTHRQHESQTQNISSAV